MPEKSQAIETHFACCRRKCSIRISLSSDQGSRRIEGVIVLADPPHLSSHQRTPSTPSLSSSFRSSKLQTSNPSYHRNQQYSIIGLTNAAGTLVERYSYTAYGTLGIYDASGTVRATSNYSNRYTYTGREYDADLAIYHFRSRWYDPSTGGFISRDPLGYVDGMSLYRGYFGVNRIDPYGRLANMSDDSDDDSDVKDSNPQRRGTFKVQLKDCTGELLTQTEWGRPNCGCCTDALIIYRATAKEIATYREIYLYQWAWSRKEYNGGACMPELGFNDPWHPDPPGENESNPAKPPIINIASMTDAPAHYFRSGYTCGGICSENYGRQDFETCAIGVLPSGRHVNLGCVHWGHECDVQHYLTEYTENIMTNTGVTHCVKREQCDCKSTVARYPVGNTGSIPPVPQKPNGWDPSLDSETHPRR